MKVIYFRNETEVIYFCEILYRKQDEISIQWKKDKYWGNELRIHNDDVTSDTVISCFAKIFKQYRLNKIIKQITREKFLYREKEEIERICLLTNWVLKEKHFRRRLFGNDGYLEDYVCSVLQKSVDSDHPIHFDSLITFCIQPLSERLKEAVGYGIDEMKREEEHQNFVQSIREFIKRRKAKTDELHIVQGEDFSFYKANGEKYSLFELKTIMYNEPLYIVGLDENEINLSPVIALSPKKIYLYGDHPAEAKTLTIINIFQERVAFYPKERFPFHLHVN